MGCDLTKWQRKRLWERDVSGTATEEANIGFANKGNCALEFWIEALDAQMDARWEWLEFGLVLREQELNQAYAGEFFGANVPARVQAFLVWNGFPVLQTGGGEPDHSLKFELQLDVLLPVLPIVAFSARSTGYLTAPLPNVSWGLDSFSMIFPPGTDIPPPNGTILIAPLDRCHDCFPGP